MTDTIIEGIAIRPATVADAQAVSELLNVCSQFDLKEPDLSAEEVRRDWADPGFNLADSTYMLYAPDGRLIGYGEVYDVRRPLSRVYAFGRVHPEFRGQGIGTHLYGILESRAREAIAKAEAHARISLNMGTDNRIEDAARLLKSQGLEHIRSFYRMQIDFNGQQPPLPQPIEGIEIRTMRPGEERKVHEAVVEAFMDHWGATPMPWENFEHYFLKSPDFDPSIWFLAMDGDEVAAFSICEPKISEDPDMGWVAELGTRRPWRKRGIALALLYTSFNEFYVRGKPRVGLGVDASSLTNALALYKRAGMYPSRQWDRYEKELRPGIELSVTEVRP